MPLRPGSVIRVFDGTLRDPKPKRMILVLVDEGWFLRINTRPFFPPHCQISVADNPGCLDHDCFVELRGIMDLDMVDLAEQVDRRKAEVLGQIGHHTAILIAQAVMEAKTFTEPEKKALRDGLLAYARSLPPRH
jgi:hypothetical protein